ncbi:MAG: hypothetical protein WD037_01250 [Balneolales bacterium]
MKEITTRIPDKKYEFFIELINQLGIEISEDQITEEHKSIVRERIKNSKPKELASWDDARKQLKF